MPWEHAAIGYIGYSLLVRLLYRDTPTSREAAVVIFTSLLPDIIDKPLAWQFEIFASGHALAHSVFVAFPLSVAVLLVAYWRGFPRVGVAFGTGYLLHLPADVIPQYFLTGELQTNRVLWPLQQGGPGYDSGFSSELRENFIAYFQWMSTEFLSGNPDPYLFVLLSLGAFGLVLWIADGMPIGRELYTLCREKLTGG